MPFHNNLFNNDLISQLISNKKNLYLLVKMINGITGIDFKIIKNILNTKKKDDEIYKSLRHEYIKSPLIKDEYYIISRAKRTVDSVSQIINDNNISFNNQVFVDIGCGDASITKQFSLKYNFSKSICVDIPNWFDTYNQKNKDIQLIIRDGDFINLPDNSVDVVLCSLSLHHMSNLQITLEEISRIIKKNGLLIIKEHNCYYKEISYFIDIYHAIYEMVFKENTFKNFVKEYYSEYTSDKELYNILKKLNFEIINYTYQGNILRNYYAFYRKIL